MRIPATKLRENLYTILDRALRTGVPIEVIRKGRVLKIVPEEKPSKLSRLKKRDCLVGRPEKIVHMDWLKEWSELKRMF
ncbi:MAG: type II toxin-antitoxin system Phd/YefM family antitoxin [Acidobacteria bacterium]|nr:type II toxin-antitoxin system Phd/YefM family antitoxin [Acidobacteriota bacterium]